MRQESFPDDCINMPWCSPEIGLVAGPAQGSCYLNHYEAEQDETNDHVRQEKPFDACELCPCNDAQDGANRYEHCC